MHDMLLEPVISLTLSNQHTEKLQPHGGERSHRSSILRVARSHRNVRIVSESFYILGGIDIDFHVHK